MSKSPAIKSYFASTLILLISALLEAAIISNINLLPSHPDISLICVLYFSLQNGRMMGETTGFTSGLFLDFLSAAPFGLNCLCRTILGYLGGLFNKTINTDGVLIPALLGFIATISKALLLWLLSVLYPANVVSYNPISFLFLFELGVNTLLTPIIFKFLGLFRNTLILMPETVV